MHFGVLVIQDEESPSLEDILDRYDENKEMEEGEISETFEDLVETGKEKYEDIKNRDELKDILAGMSEEDWFAKYSPETKPGTPYRKYLWELWQQNKKLHDKVIAGTATDKDYWSIMIGPDDDVNEDGDLVTHYNPEGRWDWWTVGGRWSDELELKKARRKDYATDEDPEPARVNSALFKDIDWAAMNSLSPEDRAQCTDIWNYHVLKKPFPGTEEEREEKFRGFYYSSEYYLDRYKNLSNYLKSCSTWCLRVVIDKDGEWHEQGWEAEDEKLWEEEFYEKFLKDLKPTDRLTVVDCHV